MPRYEDKIAEQIWQTVDALKRTPDAASGNRAAPAPRSDTEPDDLIPLAESLAAVFQEENRASSGQTTARLRLQAAIQTDLASQPAPPIASRAISRFAWP